MTLPLRFPTPLPPFGDRARTGRSLAAGFADRLGERGLKNDDTPPLEFLEFKSVFAESQGFERALRARVDELKQLQHPALQAVIRVERVEGGGLSLMSAYTAGRRLSTLAPSEWTADLVRTCIGSVTSALSALHEARPGLAHGAVSADRVVVAEHGGCLLTEYVLGSAIVALSLPRTDLIDLGFVLPHADSAAPVVLDRRTDLIQLGVLALSLSLRRPLDAGDFPDRVPALLDELVNAGAANPRETARLRAWLERTMQFGARPFVSAREALGAFEELSGGISIDRAEAETAFFDFPSETPQGAVPAKPSSTLVVRRAETTRRNAPARPPAPQPAPVDVARDLMRALRPDLERPAADRLPIPAPTRAKGRVPLWITLSLLLLVVGEGIAIAWLYIGIRYPETPTTETLAPAAEADANRAADTPVTSPAPTPVTPTPPPVAHNSPAPAPPPIAPAPQQPAGGASHVRTQPPPPSPAGTTEPSRPSAPPTAAPQPRGLVSINASPWAEVTIDGASVGQTPLANLLVAPGQHEIVFRHPQLGERRQTVVVKAGELLRVIQTFQ